MRAGSLRDLVIVERAATNRNAHGEPVKSWQEVGTYHANIRPDRSGEAREAGRQTARSWYLVTTRQEVDIQAGDRLRWGSRLLYVEGPPVRDRVARSQAIQAVETV
jgi:head-tail adaptor